MARIDNLTNFLTDVATSIKAKTGDNTPIPASQFDTKIAGITTGKLSNEEYTKANNNLDEILYQSENVLPDTYQEVEYLEASGTQYIDTNFTPNINTKAYAEFYVSAIPCGLYSSDSGASLSTNFSSYISGSGKWRFGSGVATVPISNNSFYTSLQDKTGITINGTNFYDYDTTINDFTSTKTITLLRTNTVGFKGKIYKFKLYDENNIVRNFIPCYRKSDDEAGMYDTVNDVFYTNDGTGEFAVGADVDVLNTKIESILTEKTVKIKPENIKKDVKVLGITGTYEGSSGFPPDWSELGYSETPQNILDDFDYSKDIKDNWDSSVTNLSNKFNQDLNLIYMPLVDTSNATNMSGFLSGCSNLKDLPLLNTGNATNMQGMFQGCSSLKTVPLFDTGKVTNMISMFGQCQNLEEIPLFDTSKVTSMFSTFSQCENIKSIPQFDTKNVNNMFVMFQGCKNLEDFPVLNANKVTNFMSMFSQCTKLTNQSLNNILEMCIGATSYTGIKTLQQLGLTSAQATTCQSLSNYQDFLTAGWTTGY